MAKAGTIARFPGITVEGGLVVEEVRKSGRVQRRPSHPFYLEHRAYDLQPFLIAPVLPGETMKNALLQCRAVTDPIKNKLIGWWDEYYFFYVKLTDLENAWPTLEDMILKNTAPTGLDTAAWLPSYYGGGYTNGINYVWECLQAVTKHYFRDEEEVTSGNMLATQALNAAGLPKAKVIMSNAFQSLTLDSDTPATEDEEMPGAEVYPADLPAHLAAFEAQYDQWKELVAMRMTEATFEDWLRTFGVRAPREQREELHIPELLRYVRSWQYPSNTINPETGGASSAVSWSHAERADKDRFFAEPGFIFGVTTTRPKVYLNKQDHSVTAFMNDAFSWLPALLQDQPYTSLRKFNEVQGEGPIKDLASDYWIDLRDLFLYGEQFVNVTPTGAINAVTLPDDSAATGQPLNTSYASTADIAAMFVDAAGGFDLIRKDGRVDLHIASRVQETTP